MEFGGLDLVYLGDSIWGDPMHVRVDDDLFVVATICKTRGLGNDTKVEHRLQWYLL